MFIIKDEIIVGQIDLGPSRFSLSGNVSVAAHRHALVDVCVCGEEEDLLGDGPGNQMCLVSLG